MELTLDQALQEGIEAHKAGKAQEADRYYTAILKANPKHPDANHNMGVLAVGVGKVEAALPFFKTALEANPKIAQFWLSYIDALIKLDRINDAKAVFDQAKSSGAKGDGFDKLEKTLVGLKKSAGVNATSQKSQEPPKEELQRLINLYTQGQFQEVLTQASQLLQQFPKSLNLFNIIGAVNKGLGKIEEAIEAYNKAIAIKPDYAEAYNNLGAALQEQGDFYEAIEAYKKAIAIKPDLAEAHYNLGIMLQELGRLDEALASYNQAVALKPDYAAAHSNLGNTFKELGRLEEALASYNQAIALNPDLAEAHSNLGNTLKVLGRLDEAEASCRQAIALTPDLAAAHSNLGITLQELGRLDEAEASCRQTIALTPDLAAAHSNLGSTLQELGRLDEALASYNQAIALKPDYAEAHSNLAGTLKELGRLDESLASYNQAIALKPDLAEAMFNLSITQSYMNDLEAQIVSLQNVLQIDSDDYGLMASVNLAICNFLEGDFTESKKHLFAATKIQEKTSSESKNERVYWRYLSNILKWHKNKYLGVKRGKNGKNLFVIGESHSLSSHHLCIQNSGVNFFCSAKLIKGCKQWHIGNAFRNKYKHQFETIFFALPKHSYVLLAIGEIDCRLDTGVIAHKRKFPEKQIKEIISNTIENYLNYIVNNNSDYQHNVTIQGVPCPNLDVRNHSEKDIRQLGEVINIFNYELKLQSKEKGFGFLDTHQLTNKGDGMSNGSWHIDDIHLSPEGMQEAWRRYGSEKS